MGMFLAFAAGVVIGAAGIVIVSLCLAKEIWEDSK